MLVSWYVSMEQVPSLIQVQRTNTCLLSQQVWDIHAQQVKAILKGHRQAVYGLDYSRDGQIIVSGSGDQTVRIWETRDMTGSPCRVCECHVYGGVITAFVCSS